MGNESRIYFGKIAVVMFSGKAGTGKTTSANFLVDIARENNFIAEKVSFATGVKETACMMGWDGIKDDRGREFLIDIGKAGRKYDEGIWAKKAQDKILLSTTMPEFVAIDDWRFPNEGKLLEDNLLLDVYKIRIIAPERETLKGTNHYNDESETSLSDDLLDYDFLIYNTGSLEDLKSLINTIYKNICSKLDKY